MQDIVAHTRIFLSLIKKALRQFNMAPKRHHRKSKKEQLGKNMSPAGPAKRQLESRERQDDMHEDKEKKGKEPVEQPKDPIVKPVLKSLEAEEKKVAEQPKEKDAAIPTVRPLDIAIPEVLPNPAAAPANASSASKSVAPHEEAVFAASAASAALENHQPAKKIPSPRFDYMPPKYDRQTSNLLAKFCEKLKDIPGFRTALNSSDLGICIFFKDRENMTKMVNTIIAYVLPLLKPSGVEQPFTHVTPTKAEPEWRIYIKGEVLSFLQSQGQIDYVINAIRSVFASPRIYDVQSFMAEVYQPGP